MKNIIFTLCLLCSASLFSQNTIGGNKVIVPEAEVKRQSQFLEAEKERLLAHYDKAIERYEKFLYNNPEVDAAWYGLARSYAAKEDYVRAQDAIEKAIVNSPDNQWYRIFQADLFGKTGRHKDAITVYETLTKRWPDNPEFYRQLAYLYVLNKDPKAGLKALDKLEQITGLTEETADKKHIIYVGLGDDKKAAAELLRLADAYPRKPEYRHRLARFYETMGDQANARRVYEDILRRHPNDSVAQLALLSTGKSNSDAAYLSSLKPLFSDPRTPIDSKIKELLPYFEKLGANPDPALAQNLLELGAILEKTHADDAKAWSISGDLLYYSNRPTEALEKYRQCIRLSPRVFSVWDNTLTILAEQKNFDEMLRFAEQAMDAFPNQPKAYFYYGIAANLKGQYDDAINQLEQALLMVGSNTALRLDLTDQIGLSLLGKKEFSAAITHYEQSLPKGGEQHPGILEHYGDALSLNGQHDRAIEQWKKASTLRKSATLEQKIAAGKL